MDQQAHVTLSYPFLDVQVLGFENRNCFRVCAATDLFRRINPSLHPLHPASDSVAAASVARLPW